MEAAPLLEGDIPEITAKICHGEPKGTSAWIRIASWRVLISVAMVCTCVALAAISANHAMNKSVQQQRLSGRSMMSQLVTSMIGLSGTSAPGGSGYISRRNEIIQKFGIPQHYLDGGYDWSYPAKSDGKTYRRGGIEYHPPWGFDKLAVHWSSTSFLHVTYGWPVVYHGTNPKNLNSILRHGLLIKGGHTTAPHGAVYGTGVYCSPYADYAKTYASSKKVKGVNTYLVLMCRVRPGSFKKKTHKIWLVTGVDGIRCFALLFSRG